MLKTYSPKPKDLQADWYIVDASGQTLGRLASFLASQLLGKHKPQFAPHVDQADNIIVINAAKIAVTGNKLEDKKYYRHSGYPGGIKEATLAELLEKKPASVIELAVAGMLPKNKLQSVRLLHLKVYAGAEHPHAGQTPKPLALPKPATKSIKEKHA